MIGGLNRKQIQLYVQEASEGLKKYASIIEEKQKKKEAQYKALMEAQKSGSDLGALVPASRRSQAVKPVEEPLPSNPVRLYDADVFGLEVAASDCRFEMIKLVREVRLLTVAD